jgi:hypothetical protein
MKLNLNQKSANGFKEACDKVLARIARVKAAILAESRDLLVIHQHLITLALNEAEALAWQTRFPHLVFPELAMEKVQAVVDWSQRQSRRRL